MEFKRNVLAITPMDITSPFGIRTLNGVTKPHYGIDLVPLNRNINCNILAFDDGIVIMQKYGDKEGNFVWIQHKDYITEYFHMLDNSVVVKVGQTVKRGQILGKMGMTGIGNTGYHLHFGVILKNEKGQLYNVDPLPYLTGEIDNPQPTPQPKTKTVWRVQIGSFENKANADRMLADAKAKGYPTCIEPKVVNGKQYYRVQLGSFEVKTNADNYLAKVKKDYANAYVETAEVDI